MNQIEIDKYKSCGFACDNNLKMLHGTALQSTEIHMDIYVESPYMLLSRISEKKISGKIEDKRIIFHKNDRAHTFLFNVLQSEIVNCLFKKYSDAQFEFVFQVHNVTYKLLVVI